MWVMNISESLGFLALACFCLCLATCQLFRFSHTPSFHVRQLRIIAVKLLATILILVAATFAFWSFTFKM